MLCLTYVKLDILSLAVLSDDHPGINLFSGSYKECTTLLGAVQSVSYGFTGLKRDERALLAVLDITLVRSIAFETCIQDTISFCICKEFSPVADKPSGGNGELKPGVSAI